IYYYTNGHFYNINTDDGLSDNYVYDIAVNKPGVFIGTDGGIDKITIKGNKKTISTFTSKQGLPDNIIRSLESSDDPRALSFFYIGMQDAGLGIYFPEQRDQPSKAFFPGWKQGQINDLLLKGNHLYVASEDHGFLKFD